MTDYVAYYRVSTERQGVSGLGLDAQQEAVEGFAAREKARIVARFTEVESGSRKDRPELAQAIAQCRRRKATLLIAKLDRLARNVHFISGLMESKVDFVATDNPHANRLMVHMLAAFAEHERDQISQRTRSALRAARHRGVVLGVTGKDRARENIAEAEAFARKVAEEIETVQAEGTRTLGGIADALNDRGITTMRGGIWYAQTVARVLARLQKSSAQRGFGVTDDRTTL